MFYVFMLALVLKRPSAIDLMGDMVALDRLMFDLRPAMYLIRSD